MESVPSKTGTRRPPLLLLSRSRFGWGGLQRLSIDLEREARSVYGDRLISCHPPMGGILGLGIVVLQALVLAMRTRGSEPRIHLCDASLLPLGVWMRRIAGGRLSVTACGLDVVYDRRWYRWLMRRYLRAADCYIAISRATQDALVERGVEQQRIVVITCGLTPPAQTALLPDPRILVTVGRLVPRKGVAWFVENVLPLILRDQPDTRYVIVGSGPDERRINDVIQRLDLQHAVDLRTTCTDDERDQLLARAAVFVAPNIRVPGDMEGFGIVCIEAAAHGVPVVAAAMEGLRDAVIEGRTGRFYESGDALACAEAIADLRSNPPDRAAIAAAARERYSWTSVFPLYRAHVFDV